jgi:RimJ/RimL family protein N-acetyltransferase
MITLSIRPIQPSDADALQSAFMQLSEQSRYFRFHSPLRQLPERLLYDLTHVDGIDHVALVAFEQTPLPEAHGVGVVRFVRNPAAPNTAEVAITLADEAQGHGVARRLLRALAVEATERGIETFTMSVLSDNRRVRRLLTRLGAAPQSRDGNVITLHLPVRSLHQQSAPDARPAPARQARRSARRESGRARRAWVRLMHRHGQKQHLRRRPPAVDSPTSLVPWASLKSLRRFRQSTCLARTQAHPRAGTRDRSARNCPHRC